jgi:hypothetical protein
MTRDELNDALLRFGGKLERWPQPERDAARLLVKGDAVAAKRLAAERDKVRAAIVDLRDSRQRMFAVMRAEPLDKDALQRAMADVRVKTTELQRSFSRLSRQVSNRRPLPNARRSRPPASAR